MTVANVNVTKVLFKRGNTAQNNAYTGVSGEVTIDTQAKTLRIHDGSTVGGNIITAVLTGNAGSQQEAINSLGANVGSYQIYANANAATQTVSINSVNANIGAYQIYANANAVTQATAIDTINSNIGAYQAYANANAASQTTNIDTLNANIGAYETWANSRIQSLDANLGSAATNITTLLSNAAIQQSLLDTLTGNAATQSTVLDTLTSNAATQATTLTTLLGNAVAQQTSLIDLVANAAVQAQAIASVTGTYSNTNVKSYLGSFDGNILPSANVTYSLGSEQFQWKDLWVSNNTIYIGNTPVRVDGGTLLVNGAPVSGTATYGDANVASYLPTYTGNISGISFADGNLNLGGVQTPFDQTGTLLNVKNIVGMTSSSGANISGFAVISAATIRSGTYQYSNGVSILDGIDGTYSNTNVAAYLDNGFSVALGPINFTASPPAFSSPGIQWPNGFQSRNYGNTEVAAYLTGNIIAGNINATQYNFANGVNILSTVGAGSYGNTEVAAYLANYDGTINFTASPATISTGEITAANVKSTNGYFYGNGVNILSGIASQSYVTTEINNLVNNAPALLDTLGEIAANLATEANVTGSILNSITSTNANVAAANVNISALQSNAASQQTSINTLLSRVDQAVNTTSSPQFAGLTTTANVELTANVHIHQNLVVDGNINFIGNVTQTNITTANAVFTGDTYGFGALYAGVLGYTPLPYTVIQATADYNDYSQINFQNLNLSANASTEWVATAGNGSDLTNYIDFGIAGGAWNGTQLNSVGTAAKANDGWLYVLGNTAAGTGGNLVLGTIQPGRRVNILTGGPGGANIYSYFNASGLTTNNVRADNFVFSNSTNIFDSVESIVTTANSSMKSYVDSQIVASTGTGNVTFTDTTISTAGGAGQGIILNSAGSGEIAMLDYVGINNANPGYWLHIGDGSVGAVNNTGNISIDYNNGLDSSRAATILGYAWWDAGGNGNNNRGIGAHRQFGIYKNDDLYTTKYIEFDLTSGNANLTNIAVTRVTTTNGIFWSNGVAFASSSYGNTEVAAYLPTASVITGIQANLGAYQTFANANVSSIQNQIFASNANIGAFQTYANTTFGVSSYGNTQVAAYLLTYPNVNAATVNITSGNITTLRAANFNSANAVISSGYISALTNVTVTTGNTGSWYAATINSTSGNITTLAATNFSTANAVVTGGYATGLANISVTGNATVGNVIGTSPNVTLIAGAYSSSFLNNGMATIGGNVTVSANVSASGIAPFYAPNRPAFRIIGNGGAISATTTVSGGYMVVDYNQGSYLNTTTGIFTAPVAGLYQVNIVVRTNTNSGPSSQIIIRKTAISGGAVTSQIMIEFAANTTMNHTGGSTIVKMEAGDTLKFDVTVGTISFDGNDNWSVAYIG